MIQHVTCHPGDEVHIGDATITIVAIEKDEVTIAVGGGTVRVLKNSVPGTWEGTEWKGGGE